MGYEHHDRSNSSGAAIAVVVAILVAAVVGLLVVGGAGFFWFRTARMEAVVAQERALADARRADAMAAEQAAIEKAMRAAEAVRVEQPAPRLNFEIFVDREGLATVDGEAVDASELKERLARMKDETSNVFSVQINADADCPVRFITPLLDACNEVGDIDHRVVSVDASR